MLSSLLELKFQNLSSLAYAGRRDAETAFQGQFWFYLNSVALFSQFFADAFVTHKVQSAAGAFIDAGRPTLRHWLGAVRALTMVGERSVHGL
jgi:hypothetical protein